MCVNDSAWLLTLAIPAFAEVPPCRDIGTPQIGNTCYNELDINARSGPDDASSDHSEMTAGTGWSIIDWNFRNDAQFGSVEGPKYTFTEKGSAYEMKNSIDEYTRNLEEVRKKAEAEGNGSKYLADYIDKTLKEYENRRSAVSSAQTNVDVFKVDVTVRGRCLRSTFLGCVDRGGGKLQGVVRVYKRYIGTPEATQAFLTETLSKAREIAVSNPSIRYRPGFYSRVGMNPPGIIYLWPSPWDGGKTDVWCDVPNHDMYVRNLNNIASAIEVNNLETVKNSAKYWSKPCSDDVFQQSRVQN